MHIVLSPDPLLRQKCEPVDLTDRSIKHLAKQMAKEMYRNNGCGLAAPQVGVLKRLIVIDCDLDDDAKKDPIFLINPRITDHSDETYISGEGCLSVPGITCEIERFKAVKVAYLDLDGEEWEIEGGEDLWGRCLQHELDHLDGMTMFERLDPIARVEALKAYELALANGAKPGDVG